MNTPANSEPLPLYAGLCGNAPVFSQSLDPEHAFFDLQRLPPVRRGAAFKTLFFRQIQWVTTRIHDTENVEQIMWQPVATFVTTTSAKSARRKTVESSSKNTARSIQIHKKTGTNVAPVVRAFLRADPDIIMVGKLRDKETVSMGFLASLTGYMVFSNLHTMSSPESITRRLEIVILAQRRAKK